MTAVGQVDNNDAYWISALPDMTYVLTQSRRNEMFEQLSLLLNHPVQHAFY